MTKICAWCGTPFDGVTSAKYCSRECKRARERDQYRLEHNLESQRPKRHPGQREIAKLANTATRMGMSYGKYVASLWLEKQKGRAKR